MALSDKITNIIGVTLPKWILDQLRTRSKQGSRDDRSDNSNQKYIQNKTSWVRLVSSINIPEKSDQDYFKSLGIDIKDETTLAKEFVLFGGTSKYLKNNSYELRSGLSGITPQKSFGGQYGILGEAEINKYGYRPMPGITNVSIETQGRLGSIRQATVNFKCWDKMQLDIMDTLYFKLGFTAFLEWGHTYYYKSNTNTVESTELYSINPFDSNLTKEEISLKIAKNNRETEGNYDGMLGMITNFNFNYNQEGGYDCTIKMIGLGVLAESIKINNSTSFTNIYSGALKKYQDTLSLLTLREATLETEKAIKDKQGIDITKVNAQALIDTIIKYDPEKSKYYNAQSGGELTPWGTFIYPYDVQSGKLTYNNIPVDADIFLQKIKLSTGETKSAIILRKINAIAFTDEDVQKKIQFNSDRLKKLIGPENELGINLKDKKNGWPGGAFDYSLEVNFSSNERNYTVRVETDNDLESEFFKINVDQNELNRIFGGTVNPQSIKVGFPANIFEGDNNQDFLNEIIDSLFSQLASDEYWPVKEIAYKSINPPNGVNRDLPTFKVTVDAFVIKKDAAVTAEYTNAANRTLETIKYVPSKFKLPITISFNDTSLIKDFKTDTPQFVDSKAYDKTLKNQDQVEIPETEDQDQSQTASSDQTEDPLKSASNLELILRTIQLHTYEKAQLEEQNKDAISNPHKISFIAPVLLGESPLYKRIFSDGIFTPFIQDLVNDNITNENYQKDNLDRLKINAKYGFATNLMAGSSGIENFKKVDFKELLVSYVIPYKENSDPKEGSSINYPVYITLGNLLMILNNNCTLYEDSKKVKKPVVYIDFNPNHNYCLSTPAQLSIDPWTAMIPFQGEEDDYREIFPEEILVRDDNDGTLFIKNIDSGSQPSQLFAPFPLQEFNGDRVSDLLPKFKYDNDTTPTSSYRGKIMNILLNVDYLIKIVRESTQQDEEYKVFLKQFLEKILMDVNRVLGNINALRLSYNDAANCLQIVDDQVVPTTGTEEIQMQRFTPSADCELPLLGKSTIAKSLEIKTEVTTRLANMIAISANANSAKNAAGTDGENFGFINYKYKDRYIPDRNVVTQNQESTGSLNTEGLITSATRFNQTVKSIYGILELSKADVEGSVNYYLERMTEVKSYNDMTRGSAMIPVSVNFKTDGIAGMAMGHAFKMPEELLPYTYSTSRILPYTDKILNKVGFVIIGLNHTIEGNVWDTSVRANMMFLKENSQIKAKLRQQRPYVEPKIQPPPYSEPLGAYTKSQIEKAVKSKGYKWFENAVNIVGVRNNFINQPGTKVSAITNLFDDKIVLVLKESGQWKIYQWNATTDPGLKAEQEIGMVYKDPKDGLLKARKSQGLAIMKPGQYIDAYVFGLHKDKYEALVQRGAQITVYRDKVRDRFYGFDAEDTGYFGVNIHKAGADSTYVENWSEGCQVFKREADFLLFMSLLKKSKQNKFTYTLIESKDIA